MANESIESRNVEKELSKDALFDHLEKLIDAIPIMEAKSQTLLRMKAVKLAKDALAHRDSQRQSLQHFQQRLDKAEAEVAEARKTGDEQDAVCASGEVYEYGNRVSLRKGALNFSEYRLNCILKEHGFASEEEVIREAMPDQAMMESLEQEIELFKKDYADTLSACQALEEK